MSLTGEITKLYGIPGSGKTTRLITELGYILDRDNIYLSDVCFITFSKTQAEDIKQRLRILYPEESKFINSNNHQIGTIHHACLQTLGWDTKNTHPLEKDKDKHEYLKHFGMNYPIKNTSASSDIPEISIDDSDIEDMSDSERLFVLMHRCHSLCIPLERWQETNIIFQDLNPDKVIPICKGWEEYKESNYLISYDDMLLSVLHDRLVPPTKILVVDEFQDLTPLMYKIIELWRPSHEKTLIAGDDDQTIYSWNGADPKYLLEYPGEEIILGKSYRVPSKILSSAEKLINKVATRKMKHLESNRDGGSFVHIIHPSQEDILHQIPSDPQTTVYFLFRTKYMAQLFIQRFLMPQGIPFTKIRPNMALPNIWTTKLITIRDAVMKLESNKPLSLWEVERLVDILPSCSKGCVTDGYVYYGMKTKQAKKCRAERYGLWTREDLFSGVFSQLPSWNDNEILKSMSSDDQRRTYRAHMISKYTPLLPSNIKVGTLHSAKGLEADVVFVFNNHTQKIQEGLLEHGVKAWEQEARLYYVGMTRTKEKCVLIEDYFNKYCFEMQECFLS